MPPLSVLLIMREIKSLSLLLQIALHRESEQYCALPADHTLAMDRYSQNGDRMVHRGYEVDRGYLSGESQAKAADLAQFTSYWKKRLLKWRAIVDYFKTAVENLVQEMGGQIEGILAA